VAAAQWIPHPLLASAVAVAAAIGAMHYLRCIHPPGGATALTAVIGGAPIQALGFGFVLTPVLLNAISIVLVAIVFNYAFSWRRYPAALAIPRTQASTATDIREEDRLDENDLKTALQSMDSTKGEH
jgi:CBS domain-containing membrane protein